MRPVVLHQALRGSTVVTSKRILPPTLQEGRFVSGSGVPKKRARVSEAQFFQKPHDWAFPIRGQCSPLQGEAKSWCGHISLR